ncbi:outer membrane beta-barrel protein [Vibrio sp. CAU 1672]|uniref:outer membrane beta-barrel protein n=1 Tax=Vibrio sp. CAU 1672 TaxID=3032594 RepID=UPI0023DA6747|nr:outer membrane beta-barrel protein [Vibrio sp. CAU 1672]MDF2154319.1 outer membrane beta-barrel protein [Vibrio sp. CAU 1672]
MVRLLLTAPLIVMPLLSFAADKAPAKTFDYEYIQLDAGVGTTNEEWLENSNSTTLALGGNYLFTDNWMFNLDYSAQFIHPQDFTLRVDRLLLGAGYRYPLNNKLDIYGIYSIGALKAKATADSNDKTIYSESEFLQAAKLGVHYLIKENLTATAEVKLTRSDWVDEDNYRLALNYQWHDVIGTGVYYQYRDVESNYINEAGISLRFLY